MAQDTDARKVLEQIRANNYAEVVSKDLLKATYELEHDKQFEDERGPVQASLRDLIIAAVPGT
jgi:hypothetical protein